MFQHQCVEINNSDQPTAKVTSRSGNKIRSQLACQTSPVAFATASASPAVLPLSVSRTMEDIAIEFFFANHVFRETGVTRGHFEFLSVYAPAINTNKTLRTSLSAVALSAYAHRFQYPILLRRSRIYYCHALNSMQVELSSPTEEANGSTIVSMMLLGTFEMVNGEQLNSLIRNGVHMRGAMKTISMKADELLKSRHGMQLFLQMSWCRLVTCILRSIPTPEELRRTRRCAASLLKEDDPAWRLSEIMEKVAKFRADIKQRLLYDQLSIVDAALRLDRELSVLAEDIPIEWEFQCFPTQQSEFVFGSYYHVYPDLWVACIWNFIRSCRLVLHEEIRPRLMKVLDSINTEALLERTYQLQSSTAVVRMLISDICATVPQFCDYLPILSDVNARQGENFRSRHIYGDTIKNGVPATACVYHLFWPLLNAGQATQSDSQRDWIVNRCRYIGKTTGIQQTFALADLLESREEIGDWFERQGGEKLLS
jgi:Fungal specific transcription factor domain